MNMNIKSNTTLSVKLKEDSVIIILIKLIKFILSMVYAVVIEFSKQE